MSRVYTHFCIYNVYKPFIATLLMLLEYRIQEANGLWNQISLIFLKQFRNGV